MFSWLIAKIMVRLIDYQIIVCVAALPFAIGMTGENCPIMLNWHLYK